MEFQKWINLRGGVDEVAKLIGENPRTIYSWLNAERLPRPEKAKKLVDESQGIIDFNDIYFNYFARRDSKNRLH